MAVREIEVTAGTDMKAPLSADDLNTLIAALMNRVGHAEHGDVRPELLFLLDKFERMPRLDEVEKTAILMARNYLYFGRTDDAAITICNALSHRLCRTF